MSFCNLGLPSFASQYMWGYAFSLDQRKSVATIISSQNLKLVLYTKKFCKISFTVMDVQMAIKNCKFFMLSPLSVLLLVLVFFIIVIKR